MKNKIVVANHKMNMISTDIKEYLKEIKNNINNKNVIICPTNIYIPYFLKNNFKVGIQNIYYKNSGSYTGEVSPRQARSMEVDYAIIGHSERRSYFLETNNEINQKIFLSLQNNLKVILCIGENQEDKDAGKTEEVLEQELVQNLKGISNLEDVIIAYEPIWAIGTNKTPTMKEIDIYIRFIKQIIKKHYNFNNIKVIYGGSINKENIEKISKINSIDGILVGKASINSKEFITIVNTIMSNDKK